MIENRERIEKLGGEVLLVAYDQHSLLDAKLLFGLTVPFTILLDADKNAYKDWGMGRTTRLKSFLSPVLTYKYFKLILKGERFLGFAPDMLQLGGDFVIGKAGEVRFSYRMKTNDDRASVGVLLDELERAVSEA